MWKTYANNSHKIVKYKVTKVLSRSYSNDYEFQAFQTGPASCTETPKLSIQALCSLIAFQTL